MGYSYDSIPERTALNETRDCTVVATMHVLGITYAEAHELCRQHGRQNRKGGWQFVNAIRATGHYIIQVAGRGSYSVTGVPSCLRPDIYAAFKGYKTVRRFADAGIQGRFIVYVRAHVAAVVDGNCLDWTAGRRHRVQAIYQILSPAQELTMPKTVKNVSKTVKVTGKKGTVSKTKTPRAKGQGIERDRDLPWNDKKVAIFKAMKAMKATSAADAKSGNDIAAKAGCSSRDVMHYVYHARVSGLTDVATLEEVRGYAFYLTAKGAKIDPSAELKAQIAARAAKNGKKEKAE